MGNRVVFVNTLDQLRDEFGRLMDYLSEGWHYLRERAGKALTQVNPIRPREADLEAVDQHSLCETRRDGDCWLLS